jgi:hypothetical protein
MSLLGAAGCSSAPAEDAERGSGPLFLIQTRTYVADGTIGLLTPANSLDDAIDYSRSLEPPGGGVLDAEEGVGGCASSRSEPPVEWLCSSQLVDAVGKLRWRTRINLERAVTPSWLPHLVS